MMILNKADLFSMRWEYLPHHGLLTTYMGAVWAQPASARAKINPKSWNWEKSHEID